MRKESGSSWKLGVFVVVGLVLFVATIYFVGKQKNIFGNTFHISATFKTVSGLKVGNNVRFSGINIGNVSDVELLTDTSVMVDLVIRKKYQEFIKKDAKASIGSDGLMGDKVLTISPGTVGNSPVKNGDIILTKNAIEMEDVMLSAKTSVDNAGIITDQLAQFTTKMNNGNGALSKLISDEKFSNSLQSTLVNLQTASNEFAMFTAKINNSGLTESLDTTMVNIKGATKGLNENMEAAKNNILLRGFFNKKKKADAKIAAELKKEEDKKKKQQIKNTEDSLKKIKPVVPSSKITSS
ncbi:MAG: MCE family protein [Bacteroidetes bacterium]|nr:MAG: MCE family protein [Bacteroidota bacterium]